MAVLEELLQGLSQHEWITAGVAAVALGVLAALGLRRLTTRGRITHTRGATPTAYAVAYTTGGPHRAVLAALAMLRAKEVIARTETCRLTAVGAPPAGSARLERAVYDAIHSGHVHNSRDLVDKWAVSQALAAIRAELLAAGVLVRMRARALTRVWALLPLLAVCAVLWAAGVTEPSSPAPGTVSGIWAVIVFVAWWFFLLASLHLLRVPPVTRGARKGVAELRRRHVHLTPAYSPSFTTYGANDAAMAVALFGPAVLCAAYPDFALMVPPEQLRDSGSNSGSTCGSSASACGDSSCGGSSCGGGGCGD